MSSDALQETLYRLVTANHILHYHGAVDGFGHISARHPEKPDVFIMCGFMPPALVESAKDMIEYDVETSEPIDPKSNRGYAERYIHGELYKRYSNVQSVVHSHAKAVLPYVASTVKLRPMYHMAGFLGAEVPIWNILPEYENGYQQDMLVNNTRLGAALASEFSVSENATLAERNVVLMKNHGYTTHGKDIATAVFRAIYTMINAGVQTNAASIQAAENKTSQFDNVDLQPLSEQVATDCAKMNEATQDKSWRLWVREVEVSPLYRNNV